MRFSQASNCAAIKKDAFAAVALTGGLFIIVAASSIVTAIAVLPFCIPIYYVADINGKRVYTAYEQAVPHKRFSNYLLGLLVGRLALAERVLFNYYPHISKRFNTEKEYSFSERKAYFSILFQDYEQLQVSAKE